MVKSLENTNTTSFQIPEIIRNYHYIQKASTASREFIIKMAMHIH